MSILDYFKKDKKYNTIPASGTLPAPQNQTTYGRISAYGNGSLTSLLTRKLPGSHRDWKIEAGDLGLNSVVAISMDWYTRNFTQSIPKVYRKIDSESVASVEHPILNLVKNPSNSYVSSIFWSFVINDYKLLGNAFVRKIRVGKQVVSLQFLPADMVTPIGTPKEPINHWIYTVDGASYKIEKEDMIHFRYGRDPLDMRLGRSPVSAVLREIATDNYASTTSYGIMKNNALPSIILGPDATEISVDISPDDARTIKRRLQEDFSGDQSGGVAVMTGPYKMDRVSWSPEELALDVIRRLPEERITAALGLNAMCLGLGAGLERSTYQNYERAQQAAYEEGLIPLLKQMSEVITFNLMYEYSETSDGDYFEFDISSARALADDLNASSIRAERLFKAGICTLEEAKIISGLSVTGSVNSNPMETVTEPVESKAIGVFKPTNAMAENAERALEWRKEYNRGGTEVGVARAVQLKNKENLSYDTVKRMYSFFSRHEVDKKAEGFSQGEEGFPSAGRIAWDLWGGDEGFSWSKQIVEKYRDED